jgi:adenine-specific DNA-methyltransferase
MSISYVPFFPDNIEGQALLDNFVRTRRILKYRDADDHLKSRILRGMRRYETELLETVGVQSPSFGGTEGGL